MNIPQALPSDNQSVPFVDPFQGEAARQIARAIGPAYQPADGTIVAQEFLALGGGIALSRRTNLSSIAEAFLDSTTQLVGAWEAMLGLPNRTDLSLANRQARLLAKWRAARAGTPQQMTASIQKLDTACKIVEFGLAAIIAAEPNPGQYPVRARLVFRFAVTMSLASFNAGYGPGNATAVPGSTAAAIEAVIQQMKPAHTTYTVGRNASGFLCDDPGSLCDTDLLTT